MMVAPALNTYEYQFKDDGIKLNADSLALPFIDIDNIKGLDMPDVDAAIANYDSRHGGYGYARYTDLRTIVITGTLYAVPNQVDVLTDALKTNFMPTDDEFPLYIKGSGIGQRYIMCKSLGVKYDITRARSTGTSPIQIQLLAGDVTQYADKNDVTVISGNTGTITNNGNVKTYPVFELTGAASLITLTKISTGETVTFSGTTDSDDVVVIDFNKRSCTLNGDRNSTLLTSLGWWSFDPGEATAFKVMSNGVNIMVNGNAEANFGAGYAVGANWTGVQQYTGDKHSGSKSLRMVRKNKTNANGNVVIPTGLTSQPAGTYIASLWVKGTMGKINVAIQNGGSTVASITLTPVSSSKWTKLSIPFTLASTSGALTFLISDLGTSKTYLVKNKTLMIDDLSIQQLAGASVTAVVSSKDGWM